MTIPQVSLSAKREDAIERVKVGDDPHKLDRFDSLDLQVIAHLQQLVPQLDIFANTSHHQITDKPLQDRITMVLGPKGKSAYLKMKLSSLPNSLRISFSGDQSPLWISHLHDVHSLLVARLLHSWIVQWLGIEIESLSFAEVHGHIVGSPLDLAWFESFMGKLYGEDIKVVVGVDDLHQAESYSNMAPKEILEAIARDVSKSDMLSWIITSTHEIDSEYAQFITQVSLPAGVDVG
jgi:hypothetical protein